MVGREGGVSCISEGRGVGVRSRNLLLRGNLSTEGLLLSEELLPSSLDSRIHGHYSQYDTHASASISGFEFSATREPIKRRVI